MMFRVENRKVRVLWSREDRRRSGTGLRPPQRNDNRASETVADTEPKGVKTKRSQHQLILRPF